MFSYKVGKRKNKTVMIKKTLSPSSQTSFSSITIKSKQNVESATHEMLTTLCFVIERYFICRKFYLHIKFLGRSPVKRHAFLIKTSKIGP